MLLNKVFFCKYRKLNNIKIEQHHVQKKIVRNINFTTHLKIVKSDKDLSIYIKVILYKI